MSKNQINKQQNKHQNGSRNMRITTDGISPTFINIHLNRVAQKIINIKQSKLIKKRKYKQCRHNRQSRILQQTRKRQNKHHTQGHIKQHPQDTAYFGCHRRFAKHVKSASFYKQAKIQAQEQKHQKCLDKQA